jgi:hypothetical protein
MATNAGSITSFYEAFEPKDYEANVPYLDVCPATTRGREEPDSFPPSTKSGEVAGRSEVGGGFQPQTTKRLLYTPSA